MRMSEFGSLQGCAEEDVYGYGETHPGEQLAGEQLEHLAEQQSIDFVAEQQGYGDVVSEEDRIVYRQHFIATYLSMLEIRADMLANPQDYGMTRKEVKQELGL